MNRFYTQEEVSRVAHEVLESLPVTAQGATIVGLRGELGAGKTTLVQAIASELGVIETITSPTFVIAKYYETTDERFSTLIHIDAYRIEDPKEVEVLGWDRMIKKPNTLIAIEWPEKIQALLPEHTQHYAIAHEGEARHISSI